MKQWKRVSRHLPLRRSKSCLKQWKRVSKHLSLCRGESCLKRWKRVSRHLSLHRAESCLKQWKKLPNICHSVEQNHVWSNERSCQTFVTPQSRIMSEYIKAQSRVTFSYLYVPFGHQNCIISWNTEFTLELQGVPLIILWMRMTTEATVPHLHYIIGQSNLFPGVNRGQQRGHRSGNNKDPIYSDDVITLTRFETHHILPNI